MRAPTSARRACAPAKQRVIAGELRPKPLDWLTAEAQPAGIRRVTDTVGSAAKTA